MLFELSMMGRSFWSAYMPFLVQRVVVATAAASRGLSFEPAQAGLPRLSYRIRHLPVVLAP
jgi:hypothetical protein